MAGGETNKAAFGKESRTILRSQSRATERVTANLIAFSQGQDATEAEQTSIAMALSKIASHSETDPAHLA